MQSHDGRTAPDSADSMIRRRVANVFAVAAAVALMAAMAGPALAADPAPVEPPTVPGVTYDGTLVVTFVEPIADGGALIAGAEVTVQASSDLWASPVSVGKTDAAGEVVFSGVPRATGGDGVVELSITAGLFASPPDGQCAVVDGWSGSVAGVASDVVVNVEIEAVATSVEMCGGGSGGGGGGLVDPAHVVFDGTLAVTVLDHLGLPRAGADVWLSTWPEVDGIGFTVPGEVTDANGVVTFAGLPRPDALGTAMAWSVRASAIDESEVDGCLFSAEWSAAGDQSATAEPAELTLTLQGGERQSVGCSAPPDGSPILHGQLSGAGGQPIAGTVQLIQMRADGGTWTDLIATEADGSFDIAIHAWGTAAEPATLGLYATGPVTRTETTDAGCIDSYGFAGYATMEMALAAGGSPDDVDIVMTDERLHSVCGEASAPGSTAGGGDLPETDMAGGTQSSPAAAIWLALWAVIATAVIMALADRRNPRPAGVAAEE